MVSRRSRLFRSLVAVATASLALSAAAAPPVASSSAAPEPALSSPPFAAIPPAPAGPSVAATSVEPAQVTLSEPSMLSDGPRVPRVHHAALAITKPHAPLAIEALVEMPNLVRRTIVVYRVVPAYLAPGPVEWREVEFLRGATGPYVATIPAVDVHPPGLDYLVEFEMTDGHREPAFASRLVPQRVAVYEEPMDVRERLALERLGGRRSSAAASFEYARFASDGGAAADWYYRTEASYTYRVLRTIDEFGIHVGAVRGRSPAHDELVGLNYAAATLKLRVADVFRIQGELLTSVTEVGFEGGGGAAVDIGDRFGARVQFGFEAVHGFGSRFYSQVDVPIVAGLTLSPIVEATNMPHADHYGVRLIGEVAYDFGNGFAAALRGGYQARVSTEGAPSAGAQVAYSF
jgi:hypothetical protein